MMRVRRNGIPITVGLGLLALLLCLPAGARERSRTKSDAFTVGEYAYEKLSESQELLGEDRFTEAGQVLDSVKMDRLNPHERALVHQTRGYLHSSQEKWRAAVDSFEACLAEDALPPGAALSARYNLAQLYMMQERYAEAARTLEIWFEQAENPNSEAYYVLATAYALDENFDKALPPAKQAVARSANPKEQWLQLLLTLYFEKGDFASLAPVLEKLVWSYPKKSYWMQLAAVYGELGRDEKSLAVLELAYEQGLLTEDRELRRLVQMYLYHEIPYRAGTVLEKALEEEIVESDAEVWELLANSWIQAREYERSIAPLERAAELSGEGDLYVRLGQIHLEQERWSEAEKALARGIERGGLDDKGRAYVLLGVSRYSGGRVGSAEQASATAKGFDSSRDAAVRWLAHVEHDREMRGE